MAKVENGIYVDIRRSDGRVHNAIVTGFNRETNFVSVEWFEDGETKGKEIALKVLYDTNPTLRGNDISPAPAPAPAPAPPTPAQMVLPSKLPPPRLDRTLLGLTNGVVSRKSVSTHQEKTPIPEKRTIQPSPKIRDVPSTPVDQGNKNCQLVNPVVRGKLKPPSARRNIHAAEPEEHTIIAPAPKRTSMLPKPQPAPVAVAAASTNGATRKSFTSYQDKMNHVRAERRANQQEQKNRRDHQMSIDPGNKNWQFLNMIREFQNKVDFRSLSMSDLTNIDNRIVVCVRKRPMNKSEIGGQEVEIVTIPNKDHIVIHRPDVKYDLTKSLDNQTFRFDCVFDENVDNEMVYRFAAQPLVNVLFEGGHATVFAYGQTGSGKTHTMGGEFRGKEQDASHGLYAFTAADVFRLVKGRMYKNLNLKVSCSFFELYGDRTFDLLAKGEKTHLRVLEDGQGRVNIIGLQEMEVESEADVIKLIRTGTKNRFAGKTSANSCSSRSHAIFQIILRRKEKGKDKLHGKFSIVDLAGSERGADTTTSDSKTRLEGAAINTSLLALKECIRAMNAKQDRAPFRQSKLTLVLRDSFVHEKSRTCMIAMISPGISSCEHTLNTLHYANRVKELGVEDGTSPTKPINASEFMTAVDSEPDLSRDTIESEINANEGVILDKTLDLVDALSKYKKQFISLAEMANQADYDMEKFAKQMKSGLGSMKKEVLEMVKDLQGHVDDFASELLSERELLKR
ncbi:hypothetical protein L596_010168 [Steinernema carpocapsae]|uniref:Kinesin-like protein n=1 Tax=Steinernema carpocapsae TaxID=34508 RepID=A0A4U5PHK3_STECR|nr:hypothetical protein L596_010168 [Steinernema carpocapsae]